MHATTLFRQVAYPDSDGKPMSDNTLQFDWIALLKWNAEAQFAADPEVFVAGDHLIYPVEGSNTIRRAPDTYVAFGRPKGDRGSYKVWAEGGVFPQVIFEVWSPGNELDELEAMRTFYEKYGAEEFYVVYPEFPAHVMGWRRDGDALVRVDQMNGFVSPRLGWRFDLRQGDLRVYGPDGRRLGRPDEIARDRDAERERAEREKERAERLAAKLRELGIDPDAV